MPNPSIATYFSHSYRPRDRHSNLAIWNRFAARGFYFTVDPPTELSSHTHLETMMARSSCFVAVVNYRKEARPDFCSRFVLAELGLAIQSKTPKLLLLDQQLPKNSLPRIADDECLRLNLDQVDESAAELDRRIIKLQKRALGVNERPPRPYNSVALLVPSQGKSQSYGGSSVRNAIQRTAELQGMAFTELTVPLEHNAHFAEQLDAHECVILDVRGEWLPEWVFAYAYGRFVPTVKLVRVGDGELASSLRLPDLVNGLRMDPNEPGVESLVYWRDRFDLTEQLGRVLNRVGARGTELRLKQEGRAYFESIGRPPARLFVSNSGRTVPFANDLCARLRSSNIEAWQYKQPDAIKTAEKWPDAIRRELERCHVFVALLDRDYPTSEWCRREMHRARQRAAAGEIKLLPYHIDEGLEGRAIAKLIGEMQAPPMHQYGKAAPARVFRDIDAQLRPSEGALSWRERQPMLLGASREAIIDALRFLPRKSYEKLFSRLRAASIDLAVELRKSGPQSREAAAMVLRQTQEASTDASALGPRRSTTAVLVSELAELAPRSRRPVLRGLVKRLDDVMHLREG